MASYFNADYYFAAKAKQLSTAEKPWTAAEVQAEFAKQGINAEDHFKTYGASEGLSPNPYFNEKEYLETKLKSLQENAATKAEWTGKSAADLKAAFSATGLTAAEHYEKAGAFETRADGTLLNPSNAFDANAYFAAKLAQLQKAGFDGADTMTVADVVKAVQAAGISPVSHLQAAGAAEAKADGIPLVQTVPSEQRVANDPARVATGEIVPSNYNPPSKAPAAAVAAPVTKPADVGGLSAAKPVVPTAPVKVPGDAGYIAPPPTLKDTNEKPVLPPTTTEGTGPNAGFLVVDPKTGTAEVVNPETGEVQGEVKVEVKPDGSITPPAPNAPVVDKDGNNTNDKPVDDTGKPVEPDTPSGGGDGDGGNTGPTTSFTLTEDVSAPNKWTLSGNGSVTVTQKDGKFVFTGSGTSKEEATSNIKELVVNDTVTLNGKATDLTALTKITGSASVVDTDPVAATALTALDGVVTGKVVVSGAPSITGTFAAVKAVYDAKANFTGLESKALTLTDSPASVADAIAADDFTTGVVTATINTSAAIADLVTLKAGNNAFTIVLPVTADAAAADLVKINATTTVDIDASQVSKITGSAADVLAVYASGFKNIAPSMPLDITGTATTKQAAQLFNLSTGKVEVILGTTIGTDALPVQIGDEITLTVGANLKSVAVDALTDVGDYYFDTGTKVFSWIETKGQPAKNIVLSNAGSVSVTGKAVTIGAGSFSVKEDAVAKTLTVGSENGDVTVTYDGSGTANKKFTFTPATQGDGAASATGDEGKLAAANAADQYTLIVPSTVKLKGLIAGVKEIKKISGDVTLTDGGALAAADLKTIATAVSGNVNLDTTAGITGTKGDVIAVVDDATVKLAANATLTVTGGVITYAEANKLDAKTTGVVTASIDTSTALVDLLKLTDNGDTDNAYTIVVNETSATAEQLLALDKLTSVAVGATAVATITGTAEDLKAVFAAKTATTLTLTTNVALTVTDAELEAADIKTFDTSAGTGLVTASNVTKITGTLSDLTDVMGYADSVVKLKANPALHIDDVANSNLSATGLSALGGKTTSTVTVDNKVVITADTFANVKAALLTDATKVVLADDTSTVGITDAADVADGAKLAALAKVTFTGGVTDVEASLVNNGVLTDGLKAIIADDATANIVVKDASTIKAADLSALDAANGAGTVITDQSAWSITGLGKTAAVAVAGTSKIDTFVLDKVATAAEVKLAEITGFTDDTDKLDFSAMSEATQLTTPSSSVTITADSIYLIAGGTNNEANKDATGAKTNKTAAATLITGKATWTEAAADTKAYFVVNDADSTAVYLFTDDGAAGIKAEELELVVTVIGVLADDFVFTA